ncbi:hypothetical protein [Micromonospora sagamiensis]|uniref:Uncharacterized protein n=1 Tax=Micromonospora sagamiensis TaxID=47875 RepID=A0A562WKR7_9ACTN|nr:hypothetical protein [Micromonospora sagamiensis]TWJ30890.1 hypothetical protein JD81_04439 [Micromonospora sagamiensis]
MSDRTTGERLPAWVPAMWAAVLFAALLTPAGPAHASHPNPSSTRHLHNMHYASSGTSAGANDEQFCVESTDTAKVSHSSARTFVKQTLTEMGAGKVWDGTGNWRIDLWATNSNCTAYPASTRSTIEIEVHYGWDWSRFCGAPTGYYNCVVHDNPVWDAAHGHYDSQWAYVYLVFSSGGRLDNVGRAFINHEFGHVFGLADDNGVCNPPSLMHSSIVGYSCTNWPYWYPSPSDFQSVVNVMA